MRRANLYVLLIAGLVVLAVLLLVLLPTRRVGQTAQVGSGLSATWAAALALPTPNSPLPPDAAPAGWVEASD